MLYFESEPVLKFYNLEDCSSSVIKVTAKYGKTPVLALSKF